MEKTILMLYKELIAPCAYYTTNIPEYKKQREKAAMRHEAFWNRLKELDSSLLYEMDNILYEQIECDLLDLPEAFCDGFRLGARLMMDVMSEG